MTRSIARRIAMLERTAFRFEPEPQTEWLKSLADEDVDLLARIAEVVRDSKVDYHTACTLADVTPCEYSHLAAIEASYNTFVSELRDS